MAQTDPPGDGLDAFSRPTREWFRGAFDAPTRVQREAWNAIAAGRHALVVAPTGSGKTLAAFLWAIDTLARERAAAEAVAGRDPASPATSHAKRRTRILYLSPLKALGVDVERNLHSPLVGITQTARRLGLAAPPITVGVRSGDTPTSERRRLLRAPPDILITTPESLFLMLTSQARDTLAGVETVIVDEVHAVAATKRGSHLALTLERLDAHLERPAQRIGLSATVRPLDEVARFLAGNAPVDVVAPASTKAFDLRVTVPVDDMSDLSVARVRRHTHEPEREDPFDVTPGVGAGTGAGTRSAPAGPRDPDAPSDGRGDARAGSIWPHIEASIVERVLAHRSTIVFVNARGLAERLTARLNEHYEELLVEAEQETGSAGSGGEAGGDAGGGTALARDGSARLPLPNRTPPAQLLAGSGQSFGADPVLARAHHGSVSKEARAEVEEALKSGRLRCVVATSSLELGIDMGDVDLVIQVESPPSVASGLQRVGRAGHQVGAASRGVLYPKHRADVLHSAVAAARMASGQIERMRVIANPLDVLAQQTIAAASVDELDVEEWFDTVRRSAPFASLSRPVFDATLDLVSGRYPSEAFSELRPRVVWDRDNGTLTGRPGAQRLAVTSGGTIPDRGMFGVFLMASSDAAQPGVTDEGASTPAARRGGMRVGELDEEMVYESRVGDVFALGTSSWRIAEITHDRVLVTPAFGEPGRLPFWIGDAQGRPAELGEAIGRVTRELDRAASVASRAALPQELAEVVDERAAANLLSYVREQREVTGAVPSDTTLVVERVRDELGDWRLILHSPYGRPVHAPWALIVADRVRDRFGIDGAAVANDDGIVVRIPDGDAAPPGAELFVLEPDEIEPIVTREVGGSALFAARFREAAARALLLPRLHPGKRAPLWQQRQRSAQLLEIARQHPSFPIILEAVREVLHDVYDLDALQSLARRIEQRTVRVVEVATETPSPFATTILFGYVGSFMYEGDSPLAERKAAALALDPTLLADLLGRVELRELLDASVIDRIELELQRLAPGRQARGLEGVADLLRLLGPLTVAQIAARLEDPDADTADLDGAAPSEATHEHPAGPSPARLALTEAHVAELVAAKRALRARIAGEEHIAAIEDAARLRDALGVPLPIGVPAAFVDPVDDPVGDLVARFARTHGPFALAAIAARFGLGRAVVREALQRHELARRVVEGEFRPDATGTEWVDAQVLRRIRARSLAALRSEIEPVPASSYARFLPEWQHVGGGLRGVDGVVTAIDQLAGVPIPASAWESLVLPARVRDYTPSMLDELTTTGEVLWRGHGAIPGGDGWVSLHLADTAALTLPAETPSSAAGTRAGAANTRAASAAPRADDDTTASAAGGRDARQPDALGARVLEVLADGAQFFRHLSDALSARGDAIDDQALTDALWRLVWQGHITNDSLAPLRVLVSGAPGGSSSSAHRAPRRAARGRLYRGRVAMQPTVSGDGSRASGLPGHAIPPHAAGRWALAVHGDPDPTERGLAAGELLLDRYGVVTRGAVMAEDLPGGFAFAYRVLARFEESGRARRGYFIERLGAAQFSTAGAVDRLRTFQVDPADVRRRLAAVTLAATDPANPFGAALPWPASAGDPGRGHRPGRKAGGLVTIVDGELVLYVERGGRTLIAFTRDDDVLRAAAASLAETLRAARIPNLVLERIDGGYVLDHAIATPLQEAGFTATPKGLRLRTGAHA
ncbi:DEAD/DEAH box helicase [Pseudoclavibacter endophyticus]|uniref:DEAD/DEAH box helicase n=1 Tax=Pseudoclavibacter endophyticus TaxID=1778590 RepID=A0A6H9WB78_9MICO|nr:DEAD/DEAH box helicase [Pseudoclavibacter endophyticus]KAB1647810.1 DEAD/DEAH box helicase [Pseudoclavibacter endophyticus]GGA73019.1 DEAD/DEAH box helicase [Pseudoclavibacter endophyticus]